jgi:hypothetical protein
MNYDRKQDRLGKLLILALALGCSSASLSGTLGSLALQQSSAGAGLVQATLA